MANTIHKPNIGLCREACLVSFCGEQTILAYSSYVPLNKSRLPGLTQSVPSLTFNILGVKFHSPAQCTLCSSVTVDQRCRCNLKQSAHGVKEDMKSL